MKSLKYIITIITLTVTMACTEVINVDIPEATPRLVVDASINWVKGTQGNDQVIKLSTSTPYFDASIFAPVLGALVKITNTTNLTEFVFNDQGNGDYTTANFIPILNQEYELEIIYNEEVYSATEILTPITEIVTIEQKEGNGLNEDETRVIINFDDPENETNFYCATFKAETKPLTDIKVSNDEFFNGNKTLFEYQEELNIGDKVDINLFGISKNYYNYLYLLTSVVREVRGSFSTTPSEIKGNCINTSNTDNYAFGYFRLSEASQTTYTIN